MKMHLQAIESLPIPFFPPFSGFLSIPEFHENHIPIALLCPDHSKMTDFLPCVFADKAQEIRRREIGWHSQDTQCRAVFILEGWLFTIFLPA